ncbi:RagB/SusD family nutrient uptake outer membrane protein [Chitinophaga sp. SYP-B3965]|uniref:RagB/SusD family nutrient uptake outer membrane protein n=1 Tax=Chitinophaga sp. SYP-B3965 TaxID=2663120 RepID=UPI001299ADA9|nr:RagB/SusD family nutrient uptake outer membrane protein [Chitinophaga sp. SYP-B3965]MRG43795.1 RagB/SusD family nutrient uptake outer membrane protein [Chitinophaga sp. SYP-B3965]
MIKRYLILIICFLAMACNKQLDLAPENTLVEREVYKTAEGTDQALAEAYITLVRAATGGIAYTFGDFSTDILNHSTYYNIFASGATTADHDEVVNLWTNYFKALNVANNVMANIPLYAQYPVQKQNVFIAEARFLRAYAYLDLLKFFGDGALTGKMDGRGLPIQLTPFKGYNTGDVIARSSNGAVYAQIIKDLEESIPALEDQQSNELKTRSRATKGSAYALLARTYLYMGRYADALAAANKVLEKAPQLYDLTPGLLTLFPANPTGIAQTLTKEYILAFPVSYITSSSTSLNNNLGNPYFFKRSFWITNTFLNTFEPNDKRRTELIFKGDQIYNTQQLNDLTTFKFNNENGRDNVPVIRLAEVILTAAEGIARTQGVTQTAVDLVNQVRSRAVTGAIPYTLNTFANPTALTDTILKQRKLELAFEGFNRYDLIRTGRPLQNPDIPEGRKVLPVPQVEIDISKGLILQNTGY